MRKRYRMQTKKKVLYIAFTIAVGLLVFTMYMLLTGRDSTTLGILAGAGVGILPFMYKIYERASTEENLKHMEMNYIKDYDEREGIY